MRRKIITPIVVAALIFGALFYAASGRHYRHIIDSDALFAPPQTNKSGDRRMVDMVADDSYLVDKGDSTIFILVGNFAAHHNGTVILADSAVRYSNQSFECFGNVLINQNDTYAYGDRAEYNRDNSTATLYSDLVKVVDGDAVMYSYNFTFNTAENVGYFYDGCYVDKGGNHLEAERGYYNTKTHNLIAVDRVEMRDETYLMTGDSVIFNTQTEDAQYFTNTNIWNDKDEYLFANEGSYTKSRDLHHLTRDAYILSPEREIWSDTIEYYRTEGHIIGRRNIQMNDTTQKVLGFADYGEWWDEPGNALFTRRPSMINYDPQQPDSLFLSADTLWLYTVAVLPPASESDSLATEESDARMAEGVDGAERSEATDGEDDGVDMGDEALLDDNSGDAAEESDADVVSAAKETSVAVEASVGDATAQEVDSEADHERGELMGVTKERAAAESAPRGGVDAPVRDTQRETAELPQRGERGAEVGAERMESSRAAAPTMRSEVDSARSEGERVEQRAGDRNVADSVAVADSVLADSINADSVKVLTAKQLRYRAKLEKRRVRDSIRSVERAIRDSVDSVRQVERDSIKQINDSLLRIKIDTIIAERIARSSKLADEEKARLERVKQKADERYRRKIDKAKARALRRGKEYTGPEYSLDSIAADSVARDTLRGRGVDAAARDTLGQDSTARDSAVTRPFPEDSTYKMIKAYRRVKMYRSDSQMVCDSLVLLNTDSIIRLYSDPVMWNEDNQIVSDSMAIYTQNQRITKTHFMGDPIMAMEIDTMYYNQVKGKDMVAYFTEGVISRNDVVGNAQTIYFMQNEDSPEVTGLMYIESASITFYLVDSEIDKISYKQNPAYVLYPLGMIPETQAQRLKDFEWYYERRPLRDSVCDREIRPSRRDAASVKQKPRFRITDRIDYDRRRLVENGEWEDRVDELTPDVIEWRNTRTSYNGD